MTMNTEDRSKLRRAFSAYVDAAPPAPEWGDWDTLVVAATRRESRSRGLWVSAAAALLVLVVVGGVALITDTPGADVAEPDPLAHQPGEYPHLLVDLPGWELTRVHERPTEAEYAYASESAAATLSMEVGDQSMLEALVADRVASASETLSTSAFGRSATMVRYAEASEWSLMWLADELVYEFRTGPFDSSAEMQSTADALVAADRDEWVAAALDAGAVIPEHQGELVAEMMSDIPLPASFDPDRVRYDDGIEIRGFQLFLDRYQLGAHVSGAASCAWIEQWVQATATNDAEAIEEAVAAMATSTDWAILVEIDADGDYPEVVWEIAAAMARGGQIYPDEPELGHWTIENWSNQALGCDDMYPVPTD